MFDKLRYDLSVTSLLHVTVFNLLPEDKKKYQSGTISLCHCRVHDTIFLRFYFDGFLERDRRLYFESNYITD